MTYRSEQMPPLQKQQGRQRSTVSSLKSLSKLFSFLQFLQSVRYKSRGVEWRLGFQGFLLLPQPGVSSSNRFRGGGGKGDGGGNERVHVSEVKKRVTQTELDELK